MAREAGIELQPDEQSVELTSDDNARTRFFVPLVLINEGDLSNLDVDSLE